jgi:hypothetical protein
MFKQGEKWLNKQDLSDLYLKVFILAEIPGEGTTLNGWVNEIPGFIRADLELVSVLICIYR